MRGQRGNPIVGFCFRSWFRRRVLLRREGSPNIFCVVFGFRALLGMAFFRNIASRI